jgi:hypothetical protein
VVLLLDQQAQQQQTARPGAQQMHPQWQCQVQPLLQPQTLGLPQQPQWTLKLQHSRKHRRLLLLLLQGISRCSTRATARKEQL